MRRKKQLKGHIILNCLYITGLRDDIYKVENERGNNILFGDRNFQEKTIKIFLYLSLKEKILSQDVWWGEDISNLILVV